ncbi:MAG: RNA polymerase sigma factor [Anaerolineales bacterium]|nr:RNA polymerase sigma factor [Anaerolineales bacterium]
MQNNSPHQQEISDEVLIRRYLNGEVEVFDLLYYRHLPKVHKRVRYVIPPNDVEDVTQEVFIAAVKALPSFRGDAKFSTWLRTLTNHKVAEYYRKRSRKQEPQIAALTETLAHPDNLSFHSVEERIYLQRALMSLPENYREILLLRFAEGLQFNEIAEAGNRNLEATKSLFRRAVTALRHCLEE